MSYLRYLCLFVHSDACPPHMMYVCLVCLRPVSYVPNIVTFFGLSILDRQFGFL